MADNYSFKDAGGNTVIHASEEIASGVHASKHVEVDDAGVAIAKAEDAAHSSGDKGVMALAVRQDTAAALAGTNGDYMPLIVDSTGRLHVTGGGGDVAHDAADAGNPVKVGGKAATSAPTAVAAGDRVNAWFDANGRLVIDSDTIRALLPASLGQKNMAGSLPVVLASDQSTLTLGGAVAHGAVDSGNPIKIGGVGYGILATPGAIDSGDRVQSWHDVYGRQVVLAAARQVQSFGYKEEPVTYATDIVVSTTSARSGYALPTNVFYDGADAGFTDAPRWIKFTLSAGEAAGNCSNPFVGFYNGLGVSVTLKLYGVVNYTYNSAAFPNLVQLDQVTVANAGSAYFVAYEAGGTPGAGVYSIPAMLGPWEAIVLEITPASDPTTGYFRIFMAKSN